MSGRRRAAIASLVGAALAGCAAAPPPHVGATGVAPAPAARAPAARAAAAPAVVAPVDDWRELVPVPAGTRLREVPFALHELVTFHAGAPAPEPLDCYAPASPPRFLGEATQRYALCFAHDRLVRVEAAVSWPTEVAAARLARACTAWQARPLAGPDGATPAGCRADAGALAFAARLDEGLEPGESLLSMVIVAADEAAP